MKYTLVDSFQVPLTEQICQQEMKRIPGNNTNGWNDIEQHGRCPEFSWKWLVATDIKHHYFSLVNQFFRLCGRFCSSVFAL